ncbi:MAG: aldehyde dehydrogenase family protein, partial [Paracoccaceae bacterium]|nr:aldehyde dehydrogenase family protein [Paracoccaceae bacterium]
MNVQNNSSEIDALVEKARKAQAVYETEGSQEIFNLACQAVAWALMEPEHNASLSKLAVQETGLGNAADKILKNHNKTLGLLRDLKDVKSYGHIEDNAATGLSTHLRPKGVIAAIVPSTNPLATPVNNIINALKSGNAIIIAPSPKGATPFEKLLTYIHENLTIIGLNPDLVQMVPLSPSKAKTQRLMELADLLVVTGSQNNVRAGYSSGTPALGVGQGNVVTIIDESANIPDAAEKIAASKTFDNATSCSSENNVIALEEVYDQVVEALVQQGGLVLTAEESDRLMKTHWHDGKLTTALLAQNIEVVIDRLGLTHRASLNTRFLVVPTTEAGPNAHISGEKMAQFFSLYTAKNFQEAIRLALKIQDYQGAGHS